MLVPGDYLDVTSVTHMDTPIQVGTGKDGQTYYSVLLASATDPAGKWSPAKALTFTNAFREIGSEVIVPVSRYIQLAGGNDYVDAGKMAGTPDTMAATYEAWIKTTSKEQQTIVTGWVGSGGALPRLSVGADKLSVYWGSAATGGGPVSSADTTPVSDGQWHHVALVCDQGQVRFYKDGIPTKDAGLAMPAQQAGSAALQIGPGPGTSGSFDGQIAEVRVWKIARSADQVKEAMSSPLTGTEQGLVAYCSLADGTVENVVNGSAGDLHGNARIIAPAAAPAQFLSDGKYFYVFRAFVDGSVYVHRFVLDVVNAVLNQPYEARRRPDGSYSWMDLDQHPYPEPATRISPLNDVADGRFTVLQTPTSRQGVSRWHFFSYTAAGAVRHLSLRRDDSGLFDAQDVTLPFCPSDSSGKPLPPEPFTVPGSTDASFTLAGCQVVGAPAAASFYKHDTVTDASQTQTVRTFSHVLLAIPTSAAGVSSAIATFDFEVAKDGTLAQIGGTVSLTMLGGTSLQLPVIATDPRKLVARGGLLSFVQTSDPAYALDSADGFVHLFFRGLQGLYLAAFYDTVDCQWVDQGNPLAAQVRNAGDWISSTVKTAIQDAELLFVTPQGNCAYTIWQYDPLVTGFRTGYGEQFPGRRVIAGMNAGVFQQGEFDPHVFTHVCPLDGGRVLFYRFAASTLEHEDDVYEVWQYDATVAAGFRDGGGYPELPFPGQMIVSGTQSGVFTNFPLDGYDIFPSTVANLGSNRLLFYSPYVPESDLAGGTYAIWEYDPSITGARNGGGFPGKLIVSGVGAGIFADPRINSSPTWILGIGGSRVLFMGNNPAGGYDYEIWQYDPTITGWRGGQSEGFPGKVVVAGSRSTDIFGYPISDGTMLTGVTLVTPGRIMFYNPQNPSDSDTDGIYQIWQYDSTITGWRDGQSEGFPGTLIVSGDSAGWFSSYSPDMPPDMPRFGAFACSLGPARIEGRPAVLEQGAVATDDAGKPIADGSGNLTGEMYRWYAARTHLTALSASRIKVDDLQISDLGTDTVDVSLLGYIEGAPPLPLENMTEHTDYDEGGSPGYVGSSVIFELAEETENMWSWAQDRGIDFHLKMEAGGEVFGNQAMAKAQIDTTYGWLDSREEAATYDQIATRSITQKGYVQSGHWLPYNYGMAFLVGLAANVYALRLKGSERIAGYQLVLSDDQPAVQQVRFPLNPHYTKQGTLDGRIGLSADPDYPDALHESSRIGNSYYKPDEAETFEAAIECEAAQREAFYGQYNANAFSTLTDDDKKAMTQRSLVDTVQWQAPGGQQIIDDDVTTTSQTSSGGSFNFLGMAGASIEGKAGLPVIGSADFKVSVMVGGHLDLTVQKTQQSSTSFHVAVYADCDQDVVGAPAGTKVQSYEFKTFYLEQDTAYFNDFFTRVIDPNWLNGQAGDLANVGVFRAVINRPKPCWRILHRVTEINRGEDAKKRSTGQAAKTEAQTRTQPT
jgi:Concanavalin A-like lectin/glucanases superfamily